MSRFGLRAWPIRLARCDALDATFAPVPKVASTSLFALFHQLDHPAQAPQTQPRLLHSMYGKQRSYRLSDPKHGFTFLVLRDPVERLCSAYSDRVCRLRTLHDPETDHERLDQQRLSREPDVATFVDRLDDYRRVSGDVHHHTKAQSWFVRRPAAAFDRVYTFDQLHRLRDDLSERAGTELRLPHEQTGGPRITPADLDAHLLKALVERYRGDYDQFPDHLSERSMRDRWGV